jgi:hypothetical protein
LEKFYTLFCKLANFLLQTLFACALKRSSLQKRVSNMFY